MGHTVGTGLAARLAARIVRKRQADERTAAEHAAYFARLRLLGQRLVNTREAAEMAQVSVDTIRDWARRGFLEIRRDTRGRHMYRENDVLAAGFRSRCGLRPRAYRPG